MFSGISVSDKDSGVNAVIELSCYVPNEDQEVNYCSNLKMAEFFPEMSSYCQNEQVCPGVNGKTI